jgi:arylsulfatase A
LVEHAGILSLRKGPWKYIEPAKGPKKSANTNTETGRDEAGQLYHLGENLDETKNVAPEHPQQVRQMQVLLQEIRDGGRSRP